MESLFADGGPSLNQKVGKIRMNGQDIFKQAVTKLSSSTLEALENCNLKIEDIDWNTRLSVLDAETMAEVFTKTLYSLFLIPNKVLKINDKDSPWINQGIKTAITRKQRQR